MSPVRCPSRWYKPFWKSLLSFVRPPLRRRRPWDDAIVSATAAEVLEARRVLSATSSSVALTVTSGNITLTSTDINNPNVAITRSGNNVVFTGNAGTKITLGNSTAASQTVALASVGTLTINLGTGSNTFNVVGISTAGNVVINGQQTGMANVQIYSGSANTTIGGSIQANFGGEAATFSVFGSYNGGGNLTVTGAINVVEGGSGTHQVNLYGPPANNTTGGKLILNGGASVVDTGNGKSGLRIDDGVTVNGNVSFDNSANSVNPDDVEIYSNSNQFGVTAITGTLNVSLSQAVYQRNYVTIRGFGQSLPVTGALTITGGNGQDDIRLSNTWMKSTATIKTGGSLPYTPDQVIIQGSRFDGVTAITMTGAYAALGIGTDPSFSPTTFNAAVAATLNGPSSSIFLSNSTSAVNEVVFNSTVALTGGSPAATLFPQGNFFVGAGKLTMTNITTSAPPAIAPAVTLVVTSGNVTLTSTDINNPNVTVARSGNNVVFTGSGGTLITLGNSTAATQTVSIPTVGTLTINLGAGSDTFTVTGLSTTGNIVINGQPTGTANISILAGGPNVTIGGAIQANFGGEAAALNVFGSANGGGNLTVTGAVNVVEGGAGVHQVNLYGPPMNNPTGGKLILNGGVSVVDTGNGLSGLRIDDGVTINGNVSFDNSANTASPDDVELYSNSDVFGVTAITGTLSISLGQAPYRRNFVALQGIGQTLAAVTGALTITGGDGQDDIRINNAWLKSTTTIKTGSSLPFTPDQVIVLGSRFDGAVTTTATGAFATLSLGIDPAYSPTTFNAALTATLSGANTSFFLSNSASTVNQVVFNSTASFTCGPQPAPGSLYVQGKYFIGAGKQTTTNLGIGTFAPATPVVTPITVTDYVNVRGAQHVIENGTNSVAFINAQGMIAIGTWINISQAIVPAWGNDIATFASGMVFWSDGAVWNRAIALPPQVLVTDYATASRGPQHMIQNGTGVVLFINASGNMALGSFINSTQVNVPAWGNDLATIGGGRITWSDGAIWV